mgnify:CR=1 FL=1
MARAAGLELMIGCMSETAAGLDASVALAMGTGFFRHLDLSGEYRARMDHSLFALETHIVFLREVQKGAPLRMTAQLVGHDEKRARAFYRMYNGREGYLAATNEVMYLHMDLNKRKSAPFLPESLARIQALAATTPGHIEGDIAIVRAAVDARDYALARRTLETIGAQGQDNGPESRVCRLWAELEDAEHGPGLAAREWLLRASNAPMDPMWVCSSCGQGQPSWRPTCPYCGKFDSLEWRRSKAPSQSVPVIEAPARGTKGDQAWASKVRGTRAGRVGTMSRLNCRARR